MSLKSWYRSEGFIQFLLGNAWNDPDGRAVGGRETLAVCWCLIAVGIGCAVAGLA